MSDHIYTYLAEATFKSPATREYQTPQPGGRHKCILFLRQAQAEPDWEAARAHFSEYGWEEVDLKRGGVFVAESVNSQKMRVFQKHVEECWSQGDSLVWYP